MKLIFSFMYKSYSFNIVPYNTVSTLCKLTQQIRHCILITKNCVHVLFCFYTSIFFHKESGRLKRNLFVCQAKLDRVICLFNNIPRICLVFHVITTQKCLSFNKHFCSGNLVYCTRYSIYSWFLHQFKGAVN